jgi:hypothetical protein
MASASAGYNPEYLAPCSYCIMRVLALSRALPVSPSAVLLRTPSLAQSRDAHVEFPVVLHCAQCDLSWGSRPWENNECGTCQHTARMEKYKARRAPNIIVGMMVHSSYGVAWIAQVKGE